MVISEFLALGQGVVKSTKKEILFSITKSCSWVKYCDMEPAHRHTNTKAKQRKLSEFLASANGQRAVQSSRNTTRSVKHNVSERQFDLRNIGKYLKSNDTVSKNAFLIVRLENAKG